MRSTLRILLSLTWSLWFGGVIGLFLSVTTLFRNDRSLAIDAAPQLFHAFEKYQLILAAIALLATFTWRMVQPSTRVIVLFVLLAIASVAAVVETTAISPRIDEMRIAHETHTPRFGKFHGLSMCVYLAESTMLLAAGVVLLLPHPIIPFSGCAAGTHLVAARACLRHSR